MTQFRLSDALCVGRRAMETEHGEITLERVERMARRLSPKERRALSRSLAADEPERGESPAADPWAAFEANARELERLGMCTNAETVVDWLREDRETR